MSEAVGKGRRQGARTALACLGLALFDVGQQFARPVLGDLSSRLDVVLLVAQALVSALLFLVAWCSAPSRGRSPLILAAAFAVLCGLSQAAIFGGDVWGGALPAYQGTVLCGVAFGVGFVLWLWLACCTSSFGRSRWASLGVLGALTVARASVLVLRAVLDFEASFMAGIICFDVSALLLLGLMVQAARLSGTRDGKVFLRLRDHLPTLLGVGLFSLLFGLMTQVHNNANDYSSVPDALSSWLTVAVLGILMAYTALTAKPLRADRFFMVSVPIIAAVMVVAPLFWASVSDAADALVKSFFNVYFAVLCVYVVQVTRGSLDAVEGTDGAQAPGDTKAPLTEEAVPARLGACGRDPMALPAFALTVLWACVGVGSMAGLAFMTSISERATAVTAAFLVATWVCVVAMVALSRVGRTERVVERVVPGDPEVVYVDRAEEQLRILGDEVGLSAREREVCALLVQGRSAARIGAELVLSENTVKTHLQNIYAKVGVHTKQELLDRVASVRLPGGDAAR